jgi:hypothetical protein
VDTEVIFLHVVTTYFLFYAEQNSNGDTSRFCRMEIFNSHSFITTIAIINQWWISRLSCVLKVRGTETASIITCGMWHQDQKSKNAADTKRSSEIFNKAQDIQQDTTRPKSTSIHQQHSTFLRFTANVLSSFIEDVNYRYTLLHQHCYIFVCVCVCVCVWTSSFELTLPLASQQEVLKEFWIVK